jgi:hypothetical protein
VLEGDALNSDLAFGAAAPVVIKAYTASVVALCDVKAEAGVELSNEHRVGVGLAYSTESLSRILQGEDTK